MNRRAFPALRRWHKHVKWRPGEQPNERREQPDECPVWRRYGGMRGGASRGGERRNANRDFTRRPVPSRGPAETGRR